MKKIIKLSYVPLFSPLFSLFPYKSTGQIVLDRQTSGEWNGGGSVGRLGVIMGTSFSERWLRGFGLTILSLVLLGIAWGVPRAVGQWLAQNEAIPEWLRVALLLLWMAGMLLFCPLAFEWLARTTALTSRKRSDVVAFPGLKDGQGNERSAELLNGLGSQETDHLRAR